MSHLMYEFRSRNHHDSRFAAKWEGYEPNEIQSWEDQFSIRIKNRWTKKEKKEFVRAGSPNTLVRYPTNAPRSR